MADWDQRSPKGEFTEVRDLIATVKSQRSVFEHNFDVLQRQRDLKDVCDWAQSVTTVNLNSHESHARQLVLEKQKVVQQHAKKNAQDKLEEIQELRRQKAAMNVKDPKKSKYFNVNPRLLHQKRAASDCERCTKKSSQEKLISGKPNDRLPASSLAASRRPKSVMTTGNSGIMSHKVSNVATRQQKIIRPTARATTFAESQLAQSLKEKLRISLRQPPKLTLLSVTQKSNVPTSTKATNTTTGSNDEDGRVGVESFVHQDEDVVVANKELKTPRALSIRQLPGISVPAIETLSRDVGPGLHLRESIILDSESGPRLSTNFCQPCSAPNVEHLDVWSAAEVGIPEFDDDISASYRPQTQPNVAYPTFNVDSYEDDDWLGATRQWLEQQIVDFVLSELRHQHDEIDECGDHLMQEPDGDVGLPGVASMMTPPNESLAQSSSSETPSDVEELVYTDTFEDSEIVENSEPNAPRIPSIISEAPAPQGPSADRGGVTRTLTASLSSASGDNVDDLSCLLADSLKQSTKENSSLDHEKSAITDIAGTRPTSSDDEQQDSTSHSVDPTQSDQDVQKSRSSLAPGNSVPDSFSLKSASVEAVQSLAEQFRIDSGTSQLLVEQNPSDNLKVSAAVSSTPSASSVLLANINPSELAESIKIDRDDPSQHQVDFMTNKEVDLTQRMNADAVSSDITMSGPETLVLPKIDSIQVPLHDEALDDHDVPVGLDELTQDNCHEQKYEPEILEPRPETETIQEMEQKQERKQETERKQEMEQKQETVLKQETEQNSRAPEGNPQEMKISDKPGRSPNYPSPKSTTRCNKECQTLLVDHDSQDHHEENLESQRKVIESIDKSSVMDNTASDSATLSTLPDDDDDGVDTNFSIGQIISANKLRHVAYNRMKRKKLAKTAPRVTNEQLSTASTLDDTDDLATDSDVWGAAASTSVWSEGEIKLDPGLGAVLSRTNLTKVPTRLSPGEIPVQPRTFSRRRRPTPQRVSFETTSEIEDVSDVTSAMDALTSENRSLGEL